MNLFDGVWNSYEITKSLLTEIYKQIPKLKCKPSFKVLDKEHIVGIITNSNQFVKINEVIQNMDDDLDVLHGIDEFEVTKNCLQKLNSSKEITNLYSKYETRKTVFQCL